MNRLRQMGSMLIVLAVVLLVARSGWSQEGANNKAATEQLRGTTVVKGLGLKVRAATEQSYTDSTKAFGVEFTRDNDTGLLLVVNESGGMAVMERPRFALVSLAMPENPVLFRYNVYTGEAWVHTVGVQFKKVTDAESIPKGFYEIQLAGPYTQNGEVYYNTTRIERNTGLIWYYSDEQWKPYEISDEAAVSE